MIERVENVPEGILGFEASGWVRGDEYRATVFPAVTQASTERGKMRFLCVFSADFRGFRPTALWEDMKLGMEHLGAWDRIAVVTDVGWLRAACRVFSFAFSGHLRVFSAADHARAVAWLSTES